MTDTIHASIVTDHAFEPKGDWYTLCKHCNLGESAHRETSIEPFGGNPPHRARRGEPPVPVTNDSPRWSGELCKTCDSEMVRTGNCLTCPSCGETSGCG